MELRWKENCALKTGHQQGTNCPHNGPPKGITMGHQRASQRVANEPHYGPSTSIDIRPIAHDELLQIVTH